MYNKIVLISISGFNNFLYYFSILLFLCTVNLTAGWLFLEPACGHPELAPDDSLGTRDRKPPLQTLSYGLLRL